MKRMTIISMATITALFLAGDVSAQQQFPGRFAGPGIVVGLEYAVLDNQRLVEAMARAFAETGLTGMKHFPEAIQWDRMQKGPNQPVDFSKADLFVRAYQDCGFTELTLCLKPHSHWASKGVPRFGKYTNASPQKEYEELFARWISAVVERYDGDGSNDMPGLRWPVRYVEIGSEFSSFEPESVEEYLSTLKLAHEAAHQASAQVLVGHCPFLITPVNLDVESPADYERAWAAAKIRDMHHGLKDQRIVLDHPEVFDFINIHNLGDPYEIEHIRRWLDYETGRRGYKKPIVISDTCPTSYIGWGPATTCLGKNLGVLAHPATEADRCRLAAFFKKLVAKDRPTLDWSRGFVAADHVQRTIVAAEQGVRLINLSFTGDLPLLTLPVGQAAAGISAWGGALSVNAAQGRVLERYPLFYAIKQLMGHFNAYDSVERMVHPDDSARVYLVKRGARKFWVAWRDPKKALLPEDGEPSLALALPVNMRSVMVESVIIKPGQTTADSSRVDVSNGLARIALTHRPVYISPLD
jgi:hypothetical protein